MSFYSRTLRHLGAALALINLGAVSHIAVAGDKTWDNGSTDGLWNTSSLNWTGTAWNNGAGDGAIFGVLTPGTINVPGVINVNSIDFQGGGYTLNGTGPLNFVNGTSTLTTGVINVTSGTAQINVPLTSTQTAIQKIGAGTLELSAPVNIGASFSFNGVQSANIIIGPAPSGQSPAGGTIRLLNSSVLPSTASVAIGAGGFLDIGSNNVTLGQLFYQNQYISGGSTWPSNGVIGTGTLRVLGDIIVMGVFGGNFSNTIATPLDMGGGTQVFRVGRGTSFPFPSAAGLVVSGIVSNGSLMSTVSYNQNGVYDNVSGMALLANNTYAGSTTFNLGGSVVTGTNASTSLKVVNGILSIQGASGSYGSVTSIKVYAGGNLTLDNNAQFGDGTNVGIPTVAAGNNGNRIPDNVAIELRDSTLTYRGLSNVASSETYGGLNVTGGFNTLTIAPTGTGTATFTGAGDLTMNSRAMMQISAASTVLGTTGFVKFTGNVPAAVGGIIPRIVSTSDFVFYDATNGFTPLPSGSYSSTFAAGTNVTRSAAGSVGTLSINALRSTASNITTINAGSTLNVATGMIFSSSGTNTIASGGAGATLDFGSTPGAFFGTNTVQTAVTGSQGLLNTGTMILSGDLSGLSGAISHLGTGTLTFSTNSFTGAVENRRGSIAFSGITTFSNSTGITLGVSANDSDLMPALPSLSISGLGANGIFSVPIIVDNGGTSAGGLPLNRQSFVAALNPLSNNTGSQTVSSNITLNSNLNFQGGGGGGAGATTFGGNITGNGILIIPNGRATFSGSYTNTGGMIIGTGGNTAIITLSGTGGSGPWILNGGSTSTTSLAYTTQANLGTGTITVQNSVGNNAFTVNNLGNSTINNTVNLNGDVFSSVQTGITATWAGTLNGSGTLTKTNPGTLTLSNNNNTHTGPVTVNGGTLAVNGNLPSSASGVTVNNGGTLGGAGTITRTVTVNSGGSLAPGNSPGNLTVDGNVTLAAGSSFKVEANGTNPGVTHDVLTIAGVARTFTITNAVLSPTTTSSILLNTDTMFIGVLNDAASSIVGTFNGIAQDGLVTVVGIGSGTTWTAQVSYIGDVGSAALTGGNDIVLYNFTAVPEPTTIALMGLVGAGAAGGWYYRRRRAQKALKVDFGRRR